MPRGSVAEAERQQRGAGRDEQEPAREDAAGAQARRAPELIRTALASARTYTRMKHAEVARTKVLALAPPAARIASRPSWSTSIESSGRRGTSRWASPANQPGRAPPAASDAPSLAMLPV